jgi:carboxylate-amine ligase
VNNGGLPAWANWSPEAAERPWSVRISEDVMVVEPGRGVLASLPEGCVLSLTTRRRATVAEAVGESALLRAELVASLAAGHQLSALSSGTHPWSECPPQPAPTPLRPRPATEFEGILGRHDPTCGLGIDVAVPDPEAATRALDGLRPHLPLLLGLAANSPFWRGRFTGMASARTAIRAMRPQTGLPRSFGSFRAYVEVVEGLIRSQAIPGHAAVHWDARLRPDLGSVEVAVMDAQTRIADVAALASLIQCLVRLHAERETAQPPSMPEILYENRCAATRKGMRANLIDPGGQFSQPATDELSIVLEACCPIALELECGRELKYVARTAADPGHARQRSVAAVHGLIGLVADLSDAFAERRIALASI